MAAIPATGETGVGELWSEADWGKSAGPYLKIKMKAKD
jgi:hypothetical protein